MGKQQHIFEGQNPVASHAALVAAAHELKTPLTIISHLASSLRAGDSMPLTVAERLCYLERIELSSDRMLRLVDGLSQSYRLEQNDQLAFLLPLEPVNLGQICEEAVHELAPLTSQLGQTVQLTVPARGRLVVANRLFLHNVVVNLIDNALKHNPAKTAVTLGLRGHDDKTRLDVRDNGPGMSKADFRQLSDRLGQQMQPMTYRAGSSGLGLYIAGQLTKAMGGELGAKCHRLGGMTFYLDLNQSRQLTLL